MVNAAVRADEARVNITYMAQTAELPDPVDRDISDADLKGVAAEVIAAGTIAAFGADRGAAQRLRDYVVDRCEPTDERPYWLYMLRPKTAYGADGHGAGAQGVQDWNKRQKKRFEQRLDKLVDRFARLAEKYGSTELLRLAVLTGRVRSEPRKYLYDLDADTETPASHHDTAFESDARA